MSFILAIVAITGCVVLPIPSDERVIEGREFADTDLDFVHAYRTTQAEIEAKFGEPTVYLADQRVAIYGLIREGLNFFWAVGGGYSAAVGFWGSNKREAVFFLFNESGFATRWGKRTIEPCQTWIGASQAWAEEVRIDLPSPPGMFEEEILSPDESTVYFYRPRDIQHWAPFVPPAEKLLFGMDIPVDVRFEDQLLAQLQWKTFAPIRLPPGEYQFLVLPCPDHNTSINHGSSMIGINLQPAQAYFVEIQVEAGKGSISPVLTKQPYETALPVLKELQRAR